MFEQEPFSRFSRSLVEHIRLHAARSGQPFPSAAPSTKKTVSCAPKPGRGGTRFPRRSRSRSHAVLGSLDEHQSHPQLARRSARVIGVCLRDKNGHAQTTVRVCSSPFRSCCFRVRAPAPEMGTTFSGDFLIGLGTLEERMLILVDIVKLMSSTEMGLVDKSV